MRLPPRIESKKKQEINLIVLFNTIKYKVKYVISFKHYFVSAGSGRGGRGDRGDQAGGGAGPVHIQRLLRHLQVRLQLQHRHQGRSDCSFSIDTRVGQTAASASTHG